MGSGLGRRRRWRRVAALLFGVSACTSNADDVEPDEVGVSTTAAIPPGSATSPPPTATLSPAVPIITPATVPTVPTTVGPNAAAPTSPPTTARPTLPPSTLSPTTTLTPDCVGLPDPARGDRIHVGADGHQRTYQLAVPVDYDGSRATPLVLNFHEHSSSGAQHEEYTAMGSIGTQRGYIVVSPDSTLSPPSWNAREATNRLDDFAFVHGLVAELQAAMCIDGSRIYAAGHANGGLFAAFLACSAPYEFAAVAVVAAVPLATCPADVQPAVIEILGTADDLTLYHGNKVRPSADESIRSWARHAGCVEPPTVVPVIKGVERLQFDGCAGADVVLYSVIGGAHPWPGGSVAKNRVGNSESGRTFPATDTIVDFFDSHTRR